MLLHVAVVFPNTIYWRDYPFLIIYSCCLCKLIVHICVSLFLSSLFHLSVCLFLKQWLHQFTFPPTAYEGFLSSTSCTTFISSLFGNSHSKRYEVVSFMASSYCDLKDLSCSLTTGIEPGPWWWKLRILITRLPGNSQIITTFKHSWKSGSMLWWLSCSFVLCHDCFGYPIYKF